MGEDGSQLWCMLIAVGALLEWKCDRDRPDFQKHSRRDQMICLEEGATEATVLMADSTPRERSVTFIYPKAWQHRSSFLIETNCTCDTQSLGRFCSSEVLVGAGIKAYQPELLKAF